ncbi:MAG: Hsp20/alpha crystallin family protein [Firmicutes bacterium]|nr:Hsp20/alpha crystallin family protein [Bacillota bacterium]
MPNLMRWDPFSELYAIRDTVNRMFGGQPWQPMVDVLDRRNELVVRADLPGLEGKDIEVTVDEDSVTIKGQARVETEEENQGYYRRERSYGSFTRVIPLNVPVKPEEAHATFRNGLLEVILPKAEGGRTRARRLEIH